MANTIREKLADGEDTLSLNRSINKFLVESIPRKNKQNTQQLVVSSEESQTDDSNQDIKQIEEEKALALKSQSSTKIKISDQQPSRLNESSSRQIDSKEHSLFQSNSNAVSKDIHIGGLPWEHLKVQIDDPDFEIKHFLKSLS